MTARQPTPEDAPGLRLAAQILRDMARQALAEQRTNHAPSCALTNAADRLDADAKRARSAKRETNARASVLRGAQQLRAVALGGATRQGDIFGGGA